MWCHLQARLESVERQTHEPVGPARQATRHQRAQHRRGRSPLRCELLLEQLIDGEIGQRGGAESQAERWQCKVAGPTIATVHPHHLTILDLTPASGNTPTAQRLPRHNPATNKHSPRTNSKHSPAPTAQSRHQQHRAGNSRIAPHGCKEAAVDIADASLGIQRPGQVHGPAVLGRPACCALGCELAGKATELLSESRMPRRKAKQEEARVSSYLDLQHTLETLAGGQNWRGEESRERASQPNLQHL